MQFRFYYINFAFIISADIYDIPSANGIFRVLVHRSDDMRKKRVARL